MGTRDLRAVATMFAISASAVLLTALWHLSRHPNQSAEIARAVKVSTVLASKP
jgi:uncharacterized membrane protein (GlpM family)